MAKESSVGLKKIEIAAVPASGLPTVWTELKAVKIGSAVLSESEDSTTNIKIEQKPKSTYRKVTTEYGESTIAVEVYDVTAANLLLLKGGNVTAAVPGTSGAKWNKGSEAVEIEKAVKLTTFDDFVIIMPQAHVSALINWPLTVGELGSVAITFTALQPDDTTLAELIIQEPTPAA